MGVGVPPTSAAGILEMVCAPEERKATVSRKRQSWLPGLFPSHLQFPTLHALTLYFREGPLQENASRVAPVGVCLRSDPFGLRAADSPWRNFSPVDFLQNASVYSACTLLALLFAEQCKLEGFLVSRQGSWIKKVTLILVYGGLAGIAMGLAHHRWHLLYRLNARVPFRLRRMQSFYDSFVLSLSAAVTEELVFRLLLFTSFLWILGWFFRPILR